jgi:TPR repeat protein
MALLSAPEFEGASVAVRAQIALGSGECLLRALDLDAARSTLQHLQGLLGDHGSELAAATGGAFVFRLQRLSFKHALLAADSADEIGQLMAAVWGQPESTRAALLVELATAAYELCVCGAPWLDRLVALHRSLNEVLGTSRQPLPVAVQWSLVSFVRVLDATLTATQPVDSSRLTPEDWAKLLPADWHPVLSTALAGDGEACNRIGVCFGVGEAVQRSLPHARHWYLKGAEGGHALAAFNAAQMLRKGEGGPVDRTRYGALLQQAAEAGMVQAACNLGTWHLGLDGSPPDYAAARRWYEVAMAGGDELANYQLAVMHAMGLGVPKDPQRVRELLAPLLRKGDPRATHLLRQMEAS